jgi:opacity protein-like surface antigen
MLGFNMTELTENAPFTNLSYVTHTSNGEEITNYTTSYDYDMSMHFGLFAGIKLSNMPIRVEAEYLMINSDGGDENLSYVDSSGDRQAINYNITGEQTTSGFMFNAYYDFENMEGMMLAPYVGGGIGWLTIETEDANGQGVELDAMMGYNIILGAKMPMEGFSLAFDYRYLMMPEDGHNVGGVNYDIENTSHMFNAKIMFGF